MFFTFFFKSTLQNLIPCLLSTVDQLCLWTSSLMLQNANIRLCIHLPLGLDFFTGFASMPSNDLFLFGTPFKKLRPWIVGWVCPPFWDMPFRKVPLWDWTMFCWKFWALERISAHSWNPWAWARSAAVSPLAFLILHNEKRSVRHAHCMLPSYTHEKQNTAKHTHAHTQTFWAHTHTHRHTQMYRNSLCCSTLSPSSSSSWRWRLILLDHLHLPLNLKSWQFSNILGWLSAAKGHD